MAEGQGGFRIFTSQICGNASFSLKSWQNPSDPAAPGFGPNPPGHLPYK